MKTYETEDWRRDGSFKAEPGQEIAKEIYDQMFNAMPPMALPRNVAENALNNLHVPVHAGFMMGEPYGTSEEGTLFLAFGKNNYGKGDRYFYLGLGHKDKPIKNGTYFLFESLEEFPNDGFMKADDQFTEKKAIRIAREREASLYKVEFSNGKMTDKKSLYVPMFQ